VKGDEYTADVALDEAGKAEAPDAAEDKSILYGDAIDQSSYHEFARYEHVFDPWLLTGTLATDAPQEAAPTLPTETSAPIPTYAPADLADFSGFSLDAQNHLIQFFQDLADVMGADFNAEPLSALVFRFRLTANSALLGVYQPSQAQNRADQMLVHFLENLMADVLEPFERMTAAQRTEFFELHFDPAIAAWAERAKAFEMPWSLGTWTRANFEAAGYVMGEVFGLTPIGFVPGPSGAPVTSVSYSTELCHETAFGKKLQHASPSNSTSFVTFTTVDAVLAPSSTGAQIGLTKEWLYGDGSYGWEVPLVRAANTIVGVVVEPTDEEAAEEAVDDLLSGDGGAPPAPQETPQQCFGFLPYAEGSVNFGLRVLYRQTWTPKGVGPGELVRTIPLGPGQTEKVSVKRTLRVKLTETRDQALTSESTQEQSVQTTDSSELVEQAASSQRWNVEASAQGSYNMGAVSASATLSAGRSSESSRSSQETKKRLTDSMQKASQSIKRETKVQVSTEREETFEQTQSSEIVNTNQEVSVTYLYETLQRIYDVSTAFSGVEPVVFVAEHVPRPQELNAAWIRKHDWILGRALLDESFRDVLNLLASQDPIDPSNVAFATLGLDEVATLQAVINAAVASLESVHQLQGDIANTYEATLQAYHAAVEAARARIDTARNLILRINRFRQHLADNILYYCRAIWSAEDPQRRLMRYAAIRVPTAFTPVVDSENGSSDPVQGDYVYAGVWSPVDSSWRGLAEIIEPVGPIAFVGNYSVFRLRRSPMTTGITRVTRQASQAYHIVVPPVFALENGAELTEVAANGFAGTVAVVDEDYYGWQSYLLGITAAQQVVVFRLDDEGLSTEITPVFDGNVVLFDGIAITVTAWPNADLILSLLPEEPTTVDPEIKYLQALNPTRQLDEIEQQLKDDNTREILVDTGNVWLSLLRGRGTVLEDFKLRHRGIDLAVARTELARRLLRLHEGNLNDPDVEKKIVVVTPNPGQVANGVLALVPENGAPAADASVTTSGVAAEGGTAGTA
jgi:hypothetical protein